MITGTELIEVCLQAFVVGLVVGAVVGGVKNLLYHFTN